jgi:hypothetical protein
MNKLTIGHVKSVIESEGYVVLSNNYVNAHSKLLLKCPSGHVFELSWQKWSTGRRCKYCNGTRLYFNDIKHSFDVEGYTLLTTVDEYRNTKQKLSFICSNGHKGGLSYSHWQRGNRCKSCYVDSIRTPFAVFEKAFKGEGYMLLSGKHDYVNASTKLLLKCPDGHEVLLSWAAWRSGVRCKRCSLKKRDDKYRLDYAFIKSVFDSEGYQLVSDTYVNAFDKLEYICPNGHYGSIRWNDFQQGCRCGKCSHNVSKPESELVDFLIDNNFVVVGNDRTIIAPHELDIVIPKKKIAIEYCGLYWHSEPMGKDKEYHINKLNRCSEIGYRLITVFDDEWRFKKDIVLDRLSNILGIVNYDKIYARNCEVGLVDSKTKNKFLDENHLQGRDSSTVKLGLFFNSDLVSVMTFSTGNIAKGSHTKDGVWELNRFCSAKGLRVIGAASKLLKYFTIKYEWRSIFSYADRRWSDGNLYDKLGFKFVGFTKTGYWYTDGVRRVHRFNFRKQLGGPPENFYKIWDCGNLKYVINLEEGLDGEEKE